MLLGVDAQAGHWQEALLHIPPIVAFMLGVALAQVLAQPAVRRVVQRPTRWVLIAEILVLAAALMTVLVAIVIETRRLDRRDTIPPATPD